MVTRSPLPPDEPTDDAMFEGWRSTTLATFSRINPRVTPDTPIPRWALRIIYDSDGPRS